MDDLPQPSNRARRALPLIASALTAIVVVSLLYLTSGIRSSQSPARPAPIAVMSGPYLAKYDFISPSVGWALVLDYSTFATSLRIFRTTDGASHWQLQYTGQGEGGQTYIHFFDREQGFVYTGILYRTVDGGAHWRHVEAPGRLFSFASPTRGWSFGFQQDVYETRDGGMTWLRMGNLPGAAFLAPYVEPVLANFRETGEGWLGGGYLESPMVYLTVDGAATWRAIAVPFPSAARSRGYVTTVSVAPGGQVVARDDITLGALHVRRPVLRRCGALDRPSIRLRLQDGGRRCELVVGLGLGVAGRLAIPRRARDRPGSCLVVDDRDGEVDRQRSRHDLGWRPALEDGQRAQADLKPVKNLAWL